MEPNVQSEQPIPQPVQPLEIEKDKPVTNDASIENKVEVEVPTEEPDELKVKFLSLSQVHSTFVCNGYSLVLLLLKTSPVRVFFVRRMQLRMYVYSPIVSVDGYYWYDFDLSLNGCRKCVVFSSFSPSYRVLQENCTFCINRLEIAIKIPS